ncbi:MAG: bifunctional (p)ppGpp synthetase/guanosine-3',5'-bis(diphosphate) 3'-pyrophosphohydrolase [Oligoflexales bacterium]|nr:bifunctional (p)ppGpp synthetase/guanosine-3',5'-bis(diphosphate) 3'-pyrophosphohydrolase [Oligoflexales bacterium]
MEKDEHKASKANYDPIPESKDASEPATPDQEFASLLLKLSSYVTDEQSISLITQAYEFATECHKGQKRRSGEPYITHPLAVAGILADLKVDLASIIAAILHDVVEDTEASLEDIESRFGTVIANLVDGLTKIGKIKFRSSQERMAENFRKMILAMAKDLRVILIKLADRLHNMRTLGALAEEKRRRIAQETLDIYAPLANRLGIYGIKSELEDLCLKETKYKIYKEISRKIAAKKKQREAYIGEVIQILDTELKKYGFKNVKVYGRPKHFYSIYKKMVDRQLAFEDIHDLFAFRIIVDSIKDCYEALGVIHAMWKPMPGRFKDYIAMPKANLYQSLHTTVIRPNGTPAEIQIRTHDMHSICEFGIAAHWSYKEKTPAPAKATDFKSFSWLRQMMELHHDVKDPNEFLDAVKVDLFDEEIFVFTPKGDVIQLASGATPLDFAFTVHTDVGLTTVGAKVNGKITPLRSKIHSGDIVEIITSSNQKPSKDWLNFVTTSKARNKIRSYLRSEQRESSRKIGRELLSHELSQRGFDLEKMIDQNKVEALIKAGKESGLDELLIAIGYGKINAKDLVEKAYPSPTPAESQKPDQAVADVRDFNADKIKRSSGVLVSGMDNILVTYGRCCNPLPGDQIVGFITRGRGVSIHRNNCKRALDLDPARRIEVSWAKDQKSQALHTAYLNIVTQDRQGILADITVAISTEGANIQRAKVQISQDLMGVIDFEITLNSLDQLNKIINKIEGIADVVLVERKEKDRKSKTKNKISKKQGT